VTQPVIVSKVANALVEDAERSPGMGPVVDATGGSSDSMDWVLDRFRQHYGGLWVGGRLTLTTAKLEFHPNGLNRLANRGTLDIEIDLRSVTGPVAVLPGVATKIIAVPVAGRVFKARCWGAQSMADQIQAAVTAARSAGGVAAETWRPPVPDLPAPAAPPAGWYPDPADPGLVCWWDGDRWFPETRRPR